ncbi:hypothetical protein B0H13DRAFT_1911600 [Mycena leptocephala]|nr:hypothetical protein B0H13DRAFT_1911600 [Mycena leptocephala]
MSREISPRNNGIAASGVGIIKISTTEESKVWSRAAHIRYYSAGIEGDHDGVDEMRRRNCGKRHQYHLHQVISQPGILGQVGCSAWPERRELQQFKCLNGKSCPTIPRIITDEKGSEMREIEAIQCQGREKPDRRDTLWNSRKSRTRQVTATNEIEVSNRGGALTAHPYLHKGGQMSSVDIYRWRRVGKLLTNTCWIVCGQKDGVQKRDTPSRCGQRKPGDRMWVTGQWQQLVPSVSESFLFVTQAKDLLLDVRMWAAVRRGHFNAAAWAHLPPAYRRWLSFAVFRDLRGSLLAAINQKKIDSRCVIADQDPR